MIKKSVIKQVGNCNCSGGKARISIAFPSGVTREFIEKCKSAGFEDEPEYTKAGMLYLKKGPVVVSGAICLRNANIVCLKKDSQNCEAEIDKVISELERLC